MSVRLEHRPIQQVKTTTKKKKKLLAPGFVCFIESPCLFYRAITSFLPSFPCWTLYLENEEAAGKYAQMVLFLLPSFAPLSGNAVRNASLFFVSLSLLLLNAGFSAPPCSYCHPCTNNSNPDSNSELHLVHIHVRNRVHSGSIFDSISVSNSCSGYLFNSTCLRVDTLISIDINSGGGEKVVV